MALRWFDIHSPYNRGVGAIEVNGDKIVRTSPAYRWALGFSFEEKRRTWDRECFELVERYAVNSKSFDVKKKYMPPAPSDSELFQKVSP